MKIAGIVGGIAPESTIQYYRQIVELYRTRKPDGSYPAVVIDSIDMTRMLDLIGAGRLAEVTDYLLGEIERLGRAGAAFAVLASNTPHVVFAELRQRSPIPLISIVETACQAAQALGMTRVGLFGTRFTMQGTIYPAAFAPTGIEVVPPRPDEQAYIHEAYMGELVKGILRPETRTRLVEIIGRLRADAAIDGIVLGGTELPLILDAPEYHGVKVLDTTKAHVAQIVDEMLAG